MLYRKNDAAPLSPYLIVVFVLETIYKIMH